MEVYRILPKTASISVSGYEIYENFVKDITGNQWMISEELDFSKTNSYEIAVEEFSCETAKDCQNQLHKDEEKVMAYFSIVKLCPLELAIMDEERLVLSEGENHGKSLFNFFKGLHSTDETVGLNGGEIYKFFKDKLEGNYKTSWVVGVPDEEKKSFAEWIARFIFAVKSKKTHPLINSYALRKYVHDLKIASIPQKIEGDKNLLVLQKRITSIFEEKLELKKKLQQSDIINQKTQSALNKAKEELHQTLENSEERQSSFVKEHSKMKECISLLTMQLVKAEKKCHKILKEKLELEYNLHKLLKKEQKYETELALCNLNMENNNALSQSLKGLSLYHTRKHSEKSLGNDTALNIIPRIEQRSDKPSIVGFLLEQDNESASINEKERAQLLYKIAEVEAEMNSL
ncbi:hypothetical protein HDV04_004452 [Boothiomyces sp. JEL0838]|nr:hypothetical protein HDV04_004452 [Boothiomyces sp. JEL0838]